MSALVFPGRFVVHQQLAKIEEFATRIKNGDVGLDFSRRVDLERSLFLVSKQLAGLIRVNLTGLNNISKECIEDLETATENERNVKQLLLQIIEARNVLRLLASGESYVVDNLTGISLPGRQNAILAFSRRLESLAGQARSFLDVE